MCAPYSAVFAAPWSTRAPGAAACAAACSRASWAFRRDRSASCSADSGDSVEASTRAASSVRRAARYARAACSR